jgi:hypothetical protein
VIGEALAASPRSRRLYPFPVLQYLGVPVSLLGFAWYKAEVFCLGMLGPVSRGDVRLTRGLLLDVGRVGASCVADEAFLASSSLP